MILPYKLDLLILKCIKELYNVCINLDIMIIDFEIINTWADFSLFMRENFDDKKIIVDMNKYKEITLKWINSENLSLIQKQAFYSILDYYISIKKIN